MRQAPVSFRNTNCSATRRRRLPKAGALQSHNLVCAHLNFRPVLPKPMSRTSRCLLSVASIQGHHRLSNGRLLLSLKSVSAPHVDPTNRGVQQVGRLGEWARSGPRDDHGAPTARYAPSAIACAASIKPTEHRNAGHDLSVVASVGGQGIRTTGNKLAGGGQYLDGPGNRGVGQASRLTARAREVQSSWRRGCLVPC
jgi:hypothetical protein